MGYGDYTFKEKRGVPLFLKKFLFRASMVKAPMLFVGERANSMVFSSKNRQCMT
jgi:hypothetical protein